MTKNHLVEIACAAATFIILPLAMLYIPPKAQGAPVKPVPMSKESPRKTPASLEQARTDEKQVGAPAGLSHLTDRNIFADNGTYIVPKTGGPAPTPQEVKVLGIVNPGVRRAFIVDPFGRVLDLKTGDNVDGLQVKKITDTAVFLRMGNKDMEIKLFAIATPQKPGALPQGASTAPAPQQVPPTTPGPPQKWTPPTAPTPPQQWVSPNSGPAVQRPR
jgi:hypothetical protein